MSFLDNAGVTAQIGFIKAYVNNQVTALTELINNKAAANHTHTKTALGLGNVENTADSTKNVATAVSATSATKDSAGNTISTTYLKIADASEYTSSEVETIWNAQAAEE